MPFPTPPRNCAILAVDDPVGEYRSSCTIPTQYSKRTGGWLTCLLFSVSVFAQYTIGWVIVSHVILLLYSYDMVLLTHSNGFPCNPQETSFFSLLTIAETHPGHDIKHRRILRDARFFLQYVECTCVCNRFRLGPLRGRVCDRCGLDDRDTPHLVSCKTSLAVALSRYMFCRIFCKERPRLRFVCFTRGNVVGTGTY